MIPVILANNYHRVSKCSYSNQDKADRSIPGEIWSVFLKALRSLLQDDIEQVVKILEALAISGIIAVFYSPVTLPWYYLLHGKTLSVLSVSIIREW